MAKVNNVFFFFAIAITPVYAELKWNRKMRRLTRYQCVRWDHSGFLNAYLAQENKCKFNWTSKH